MLIILGKKIARFPWPDGRGETVLYQADPNHGGGFFLHTRGAGEESIGACTSGAAQRWMAHEGIEQLATVSRTPGHHWLGLYRLFRRLRRESPRLAPRVGQ
jgi:hypothetical protein